MAACPVCHPHFPWPGPPPHPTPPHINPPQVRPAHPDTLPFTTTTDALPDSVLGVPARVRHPYAPSQRAVADWLEGSSDGQHHPPYPHQAPAAGIGECQVSPSLSTTATSTRQSHSPANLPTRPPCQHGTLPPPHHLTTTLTSTPLPPIPPMPSSPRFTRGWVLISTTRSFRRS